MPTQIMKMQVDPLQIFAALARRFSTDPSGLHAVRLEHGRLPGFLDTADALASQPVVKIECGRLARTLRHVAFI